MSIIQYIGYLMKKLFLSSLIAVIVSLPAYSNIDLNLSTKEVKQGQFFSIEIKDLENKLDKPVASFNNLNIPMFKKTENTYKVYFGIPADMKKGEYDISVTDSNNNKNLNSKIKVKEVFTGSQNISYYRPKLTKDQEDLIKKEDEFVSEAKKSLSEEQLWKTPFILPVPHRVSAIYGIKRYLNGKYNNYHSGVDFASPMGYPVKAINNGKVILAKYFSKYNANGNIVFLDHGHGLTSIYLHLSKIAVKEGQTISKGSILGYIGSSGRSTGPHLHWGVYLNGQNTDGLNLVKNLK